MSRINLSTLSLYMATFTAVAVIGFSYWASDARADLRRMANLPVSWFEADLGYYTGPKFGAYIDYLNDYYSQQGSKQTISDFGGRLALNVGYKSFFSSHFAYGLFLSAGGFSTDQVFDFTDDTGQSYQAYEEYQYKTANAGVELSFSPVNTRSTRIVPYISAGGMLSSGTLDILYSDIGPAGTSASSYGENTFNVGYRFAAGLVIPISTHFAINTSSFYNNSRLTYDAKYDNGKSIKIKNNQWFAGIGLVYFHR